MPETAALWARGVTGGGAGTREGRGLSFVAGTDGPEPRWLPCPGSLGRERVWGGLISIVTSLFPLPASSQHHRKGPAGCGLPKPNLSVTGLD